MARFISDLAYNPAFPHEWEGLGYESARDATPCWYGVSSGNGNNGVSHLYPDYYVRTCEPWTLASAAIIAQFNPDFYVAAQEAADIDGEAEYCISATIYNPEDVDPAEAPSPDYHLDCTCNACGAFWEDTCTNEFPHMECAKCGSQDVEIDSEEIERDGDDSYSAANGAWLIVEVFPVDDMDQVRSSAMRYDNLDEALSADVVAMARAADLILA